LFAHRGVQHVLCCAFVLFLSMLPVSLDRRSICDRPIDIF